MEREMLFAPAIADADRLLYVREVGWLIPLAAPAKMKSRFTAVGTNGRGFHRIIERATELILPHDATLESIERMLKQLRETYSSVDNDLRFTYPTVLVFTDILVNEMMRHGCIPIIERPIATYVV